MLGHYRPCRSCWKRAGIPLDEVACWEDEVQLLRPGWLVVRSADDFVSLAPGHAALRPDQRIPVPGLTVAGNAEAPRRLAERRFPSTPGG